MGRSWSQFLGFLLACLNLSPAPAQPPADGVVPLPPIAATPSAGGELTGVLSEETVIPDSTGLIPRIDPPPEPMPLDGFLGYRYGNGTTDWIVGTGNQFGMFTLASTHYQEAGVRHGIGADVQFHFLSGPVRTDMPPRVFDFGLGYQHRDRLGVFSYDVAASIVASSDFEGSSRKGIRYPAHAVGFLSLGPSTELVFGADYVDRGDFKLLPVGGLIAVPSPWLRLEAVFPRPRAVFQLTEKHQLFVGGELGGSSWAIERTNEVDDLATYRDLRLCVGLQTIDAAGQRSAIEIGYLFDRRLEYTSGDGDFSPNDTVMIRLGQTY